MRFLMAVLACALLLPASQVLAADQPDYSRQAPDLFCPGWIHGLVAVHQTALDAAELDLGRDSRFGFQVRADTPKTLAGTVVVLAGTTVYKAAFPAEELRPVTVTEKEDGHVTKTRTYYDSKPIALDFPASVPIDAVWLDETVVDGVAKPCATMPDTYSPNHVPPEVPAHFETDDAGLTAAQVRSAALGAVAIRARRVGVMSREGCSSLITDASALQIEHPEYPLVIVRRGISAIVRVAIDSSGSVADASILKSTGELAFDLSALVAAWHSRFHPRQFLCSPIPGVYSLRFKFS